MCQYISRYTRCALALIYALLIAGCSPPVVMARGAVPSSGPIAITHITMFDVSARRLVPDVSLLIVAGRIAVVDPSKDFVPPTDASICDGRGLYVLPGLWDMHVHLTVEGESALPEYVAHGITGVRDMGGNVEAIRAMKRDVLTGVVQGPRILFAGPMLESPEAMVGLLVNGSPDDSSAARRDRALALSPAQAATVVDSIARLGVDMIKARDFTDAATYWAIASNARRAGLPFVGHAPFGLGVDPIALADSGQSDMEHWFYPLDLFKLPTTRYESIVGEYRRNGLAFTPTLVAWRQHRYTVDSLQRLLAAALSDPRAATTSSTLIDHWKGELAARRTEIDGQPATVKQLSGWNRVLDEFARQVATLSRAGVTTMAGSDLPFARYPGDGLQEEIIALVREGGLTPADALLTATLEPARFLKLERTGKIGVGMNADLVILAADPLADILNIRRVKAVMINGRWARLDAH